MSDILVISFVYMQKHITIYKYLLRGDKSASIVQLWILNLYRQLEIFSFVTKHMIKSAERYSFYFLFFS